MKVTVTKTIEDDLLSFDIIKIHIWLQGLGEMQVQGGKIHFFYFITPSLRPNVT